MSENIAILGSTGSIGLSTLEVIENNLHRFRVAGLAAGRNIKLLAEQVNRYKPDVVSLERKDDAEAFQKDFGREGMKILWGQEGTVDIARMETCSIVVAAITGIDGLRSTLEAVKAGKKVALANKESMVVAGSLICKAARENGASIIPVDSEHSGVFQCLAKEEKKNVKKIILTASGGPFFRSTKQEMENSTLSEALNHPRWKMGAKVTIDSATMMNKGLELIEARWLFDLEPGQLDVLIHPQSIVHALVEMRDGSMIAQLSPTDMKIPIQYALTYPDRGESPLPSLELSQVETLEFYHVDREKFPLINLARMALTEGESLPVVLNAANEITVASFLNKDIRFSEIYPTIKAVIEDHKKIQAKSLEDILRVDREARTKTRNILEQRL